MITSSDDSKACKLKSLSQAQVSDYHGTGFLIVRSVFSGREVSELAEDAERIAYAQTDLIDSRNMRVRFKTHITTGQPVFEVLDPIADLSPVASSIARDQRLFDILHDIYGEPAKLFKDKLIYKPPGADGATLHQD